jgi:cell fate regulator YaaT (PSP1 superfamily)
MPDENTGENAVHCSRCHNGRNKLDVFNWLKDIPEDGTENNLVEVRFKNTRKAYYINNMDIYLEKGDIVAVEASPGHDIGVVSLTGALVPVQMKCNGVSASGLKKIYRKAKSTDTEKWFQAIGREQETMRIARQMVTKMDIPMKISDVEYQGDKTKATFYYISDDRVDFRQLIKEYAEYFRIRIEMKQIGARQEAGKVGGIGTCGRELCCSKWMSSFISVSTHAVRYQEMSLNLQKLAGQCGKLKCCLNYELKCYIDAQQDFPDTSVPLETEQGRAYRHKIDIFRRIVWYSFKKDDDEALIPLDVDVVKEIIRMNRQGIKAKELTATEEAQDKKPVDISYRDAVGEDSINRFEEQRRNRKKKNRTENLFPKPQGTEPRSQQGQGQRQNFNQNPNSNRHNRYHNRDRKNPNDRRQPSAE